MKSFKHSLIALILLTGANIFAQSSDLFTKSSTNTDRKVPEMSDYLLDEVKPDFKIISSNSSYIEFEYYPSAVREQKFIINGENLSTYEFHLGLDNALNKAGTPYLKYRSLSIFLQSKKGNTVQVIDFDMKEDKNINIAPVASVGSFNPNIRSFENIYYIYNKNAEYSQNKYLPENLVSLDNQGPLRDLAAGNVVIYPFQYNPVTRSVKYYSRIRIRINFGEAPVQRSGSADGPMDETAACLRIGILPSARELMVGRFHGFLLRNILTVGGSLPKRQPSG